MYICLLQTYNLVHCRYVLSHLYKIDLMNYMLASTHFSFPLHRKYKKNRKFIAYMTKFVF